MVSPSIYDLNEIVDRRVRLSSVEKYAQKWQRVTE